MGKRQGTLAPQASSNTERFIKNRNNNGFFHEIRWMRIIIFSVAAIGILIMLAPTFLLNLFRTLSEKKSAKENNDIPLHPPFKEQNLCVLTKRSTFFSVANRLNRNSIKNPIRIDSTVFEVFPNCSQLEIQD